jgi:hypothetical protein
VIKPIYNIKDLIEKAITYSGKCLSTEYTTSKSNYEWECSEGHKFCMTWSQINNKGSWCEVCRIKKMSISSRKYSTQSLQDLATTKNSICLSTSYTGIFDKYKFICEKGHEFTIRWSEACRGSWCQECTRYKHDLKDLNQYAISRNGKCTSQVYTGDKTEYSWECYRGHSWKAQWHNVYQNSTWCKECYKLDRIGKARKYSKVDAENYATSRGGKLLSPTFGIAKDKYEWQCSEGHTWTATFHGMIQKGYWCSLCSDKQRGLDCRKYDITHMQEKAGTKKGKCLSKEYLGMHVKLLWECKKGHTFETKPADVFHHDTWCPSCKPYGKTEQQVRTFVEQTHLTEKIKKLSQIGIESNHEIDIYIPKLKLGIEYGGLRWHSELYKSDNNYHFNKYKTCKDNNIRLITIFADEWLYRNSQVKNYLKSVLNINTIKIPARKCIVKIIDNKIAVEFINKYHIQSILSIKIGFGIFYNNELVGVMTGNNHHRNSNNKILVLSRMVFKDDIILQGGASKLFKSFKEYARLQEYNKIITWADLRWTEGAVYYKMGMSVEATLQPDYSYTKNFLTRISKQSCKKEKLLVQGAVGNTEHEMAKSLGLYRIYDCGKIRFSYNL